MNNEEIFNYMRENKINILFFNLKSYFFNIIKVKNT